MPGKDKTGPFGQGSKTGRGMGACRRANGAMGSNFGVSSRGVGGGETLRGGGLGRCLGGRNGRFSFDGSVSEAPENEAQSLRNRIDALIEELAALEARLSASATSD